MAEYTENYNLILPKRDRTLRCRNSKYKQQNDRYGAR